MKASHTIRQAPAPGYYISKHSYLSVNMKHGNVEESTHPVLMSNRIKNNPTMLGGESSTEVCDTLSRKDVRRCCSKGIAGSF